MRVPYIPVLLRRFASACFYDGCAGPLHMYVKSVHTLVIGCTFSGWRPVGCRPCARHVAATVAPSQHAGCKARGRKVFWQPYAALHAATCCASAHGPHVLVRVEFHLPIGSRELGFQLCSLSACHAFCSRPHCSEPAYEPLYCAFGAWALGLGMSFCATSLGW